MTLVLRHDFLQPTQQLAGRGGRDEWGCEWVVEPGSKDMGQVKNIVLPDLASYAQVAVPDVRNPRRYAHWGPILDRAEREGKYVVLCNGPFLFERAHCLPGGGRARAAARATASDGARRRNAAEETGDLSSGFAAGGMRVATRVTVLFHFFTTS